MNKLKSLVAAAAAFSSLALTVPEPVQADDWDFVIAPYALVPFIDGSASIGRLEAAGVNVDPVDIIEILELGGMLHAEARHRSGFGVMLDYAFMDLGDGATILGGASRVEVDVFQGILEAYGSYRTVVEGATIDFYGGIRWWDIDMDVNVTGALTARVDSGDSWVDPVIGARGSLPIGESDWRILLQGDIGGFGVGSEFSWNLQGGTAWDVNDWFSLALEYRALAVDRRTGTEGTTDRFVYDTVTHGPLIGLVFRM